MSDVPDDFRETPLGPLPETWKVVRLGEVLEQRIEKVEVKPDGEYTRLGVHWYAAGPFKKDVVLGEEIRSKYLYKVEPEHFIYNRLFGWKGSFGVVSEDMADCHVSSEFPLFRVAGEIADPWYLWRWFSQSSVWKRIEDQSMGSTRTSRLRLKVADLLAMEVPLPPLPEQRAIANVLRTVQRAREATEEVIAAVQELKRSLMRHLFTYGPVPVHEAERVELQETEIGPIPADWEVVALGQAIKGTQYGTSSRAESTGKYPMLRMNNLVNGRIDTRDLKYIDLDDDEFAKFKVNRGDVLFNRTNSFELVGKTSIFDLEGDYVFASYLVRVIGDGRKLHPGYLNYFLNWQSAQDRLKQLATRGVSQSNISATKLRGFNIGLPSLPEQREIARILSTVDAKIEAEEARREALDGLFHSLLHHLMTGRIRTQGFQCQAARTPSREEENLGDFAP